MTTVFTTQSLFVICACAISKRGQALNLYVFEHPATKQRKIVKLGFAWDALFLNWFFGLPLLRRGLWFDGIFGFLAMLFMMAVFPIGVVGIIAGSGLYEGFTANRSQAQKLHGKGYRIVGDEGSRMLAETSWKLDKGGLTPALAE